MLIMTSKLRVNVARMTVLGAELITPLYADACTLLLTFKDLHTWCIFSLRWNDALSELQQNLG